MIHFWGQKSWKFSFWKTTEKSASNRVMQYQKRQSSDVWRFQRQVPSYNYPNLGVSENESLDFLKTFLKTPCTVFTYTKSPKPTMQHLIIGHPEPPAPPHSRPPVLPGFTLQHAGVGRGKATCRQAWGLRPADFRHIGLDFC